MSVNKNRPHVLVLPEDDANRQLAKSFHLTVELSQQRQMQVLAVAGGWREVLSLFKSDHIAEMNRYPQRFMLLLIDFDNDANRLDHAKAAIPRDLADRVFVLGALTNPEELKTNLGSYETIGSALAKECREENYTTSGWKHDLLRHNAGELDRLRQHVRPILF